MKINDYFTFKPDDEKQSLIQKMHGFLINDKQVFILKGYAGSGKTTFLNALAIYLSKMEREFYLFASTGRAAKILRDKTNYPTSTIHLGIYTFSDELISDNYRLLMFKLAHNFSPANTIYIIDESSMISNRKSKTTFVDFGTGALLDDIFSYVSGRKIIFVGDQGQLPPVNSDISPALNSDYLDKHYFAKSDFFTLQNIHRQKINSGIVKLSNFFINSFANKSFKRLNLKIRGNADIIYHDYEQNLIKSFVSQYDKKSDSNSAIITISNRKVFELNLIVRSYLFNNHDIMMPQEQFLVYANNYLYNVFNGEGMVLRWASNKVKAKAGLHFRKCKFGFLDGKRRDFEAFIIEEYLTAPKPELSAEKERNLLIDFSYRMKKLRITPKHKQLWVENLKNDPYLNALRIRYSYALTCHKAQGGEWDNVFLIFENYFGHFPTENQYRWTYTAISRARNKLHILRNQFIY